jgi:hypothetical protein
MRRPSAVATVPQLQRDRDLRGIADLVLPLDLLVDGIDSTISIARL